MARPITIPEITEAGTLVIDTGTVLSYGKVTLTFESVSDADKVEQANKLLALHPELSK